jgi:hypothetical protein
MIVQALAAGPGGLGRRLWQLLAGAGALTAAAGWWVAIVELTPAASRPYIGGSTSNSIIQLALGYNGLGRLDGSETGSVGFGGAAGGRGGGGPAFGGQPGLTRLFGAEMGGQVSWLLPAALISLALLLWITRRAPRTDRRRAAALLWGGWLLLTGAVFSLMAGIIHPYYTVALAPAIAALAGIGAVTAWQARTGGAGFPGAVAGGAPGSRAGRGLPGARTGAGSSGGAAGQAGPGGRAGAAGQGTSGQGTSGQGNFGVRAGGPGGAAGGPGGSPGGGLGGATQVSRALTTLLKNTAGYRWAAATVGAESAAPLQLASRRPVMAIGGFNGTDPAPSLGQFERLVAAGEIRYFVGANQDSFGGGSGAATKIVTWVRDHFRSRTVGGVTVYDLTRPRS